MNNKKRLRAYQDKKEVLETLPAFYERPLLINEKYNSWQRSYVKKPESKFKSLILQFLP